MNLLFGLTLGITIGLVHSFAINNAGAMKTLTEKWQNEDVLRNPAARESPMYGDDEEFHAFYEILSSINWHLRQIYDLSKLSKLAWGMSYEDFMSTQIGIPCASDEFIKNFAYNLSEIYRVQDITRLLSDVFYEDVPPMAVPGLLQVVNNFIDPFYEVTKEFRGVYKEVYRWAIKTNFPHDFPLQHTSVDQVESLMETFQLFVTQGDAMLQETIPGYESVYQAKSATINRQYAEKVLECTSFNEFLTSVLDYRGVDMGKPIQKVLALFQSKEIKSHVMGLSRELPVFLEMLDYYGILGIELIAH